jgi:tetratricopeptide (TPR) repeat protein
MSTRRSPQPSVDAPLRKLARRARQLRRAGRLDAASAAVDSALHLASDAPRAELITLACAIELDRGRIDGVEARLTALLSVPARASDGAAHALACARAHYELGRLCASQRRFAAAHEHLLAALHAPDRPTVEGEPGALLRLRALATLGTTDCMQGQHAQGLAHLEAAHAGFGAPGLEAAALDHARVLINLGAAHFEQRRLDEGQRWSQCALAQLAPELAARRAGARADLGRALINLGGIHSQAGRFDQAIACYHDALAAFERAARSARRGGDPSRLRGSWAKASMNLGHTLYKAGDFAGARRHLGAALRRYRPLMQTSPNLLPDVARTWVNEAHLVARRGQADRAHALYTRGLKTFQRLMRGAASSPLRPDAANARLGLARVDLMRGHGRGSARRFEQAMAVLRELSHEGRLECADAWLEAWIAQAATLVAQPAPEREAQAMVRALSRVLRSPPLRALGELDEPLRAPAAALDAIDRWRRDRAGAALPGWLDALSACGLDYLLDCTAQVLADSSPPWLHRQGAAMRLWVERLGVAAAAQPRAAPLLAQWFLRTRGLRAQRLAIAAASDERVAGLRAALEDLSRLESDLLGAVSPPQPDDTPGARGGRLLDAGGSAEAGETERRFTQWRALRQRVAEGTGDAVAQGLLPPALRLGVDDLARQLAAGQALLLLARLDRARVVVLCVHAGAVRSRVVVLPPPLCSGSCDLFNAAARQALRHDFAPFAARELTATPLRPVDMASALEDSAGDRIALEALREIGRHLLAPALSELRAAACGEIDIVPADDLHLLPWSDLTRPWLADFVSIDVYPSAGAWLRGRTQRPRDALPRWALAAAPGHGGTRALRWVDVERRCSLRLWQQAGARIGELGAASDADSLLVMGHGLRPHDNPALAGVLLDDGRMLAAHDVASAGAFDHVLLSACVLGRTDEAFGEPLGFLSACLALRSRFGVGWLTEVPDEAACLFSLALQFALRDALRAGAEHVRWSRVFHATCTTIADGAWPAGFTAWLGDDAWVSDAVPAATPPAMLRRVLPWVLALGR